MSDATRPTAGDPRPTDPSQVSEAEMQEYASKLRSAPAEQLVTEVLYGLLNAAQAKLGRRDARLLIDLAAVMLGQVRPYVSTSLVEQSDQVLGQLRLAQVRVESAPADQREAEPNDLAETPKPPAEGAAPAAPAAPAAQQPTPPAAPPGPSPASRLWVPGRDF